MEMNGANSHLAAINQDSPHQNRSIPLDILQPLIPSSFINDEICTLAEECALRLREDDCYTPIDHKLILKEKHSFHGPGSKFEFPEDCELFVQNDGCIHFKDRGHYANYDLQQDHFARLYAHAVLHTGRTRGVFFITQAKINKACVAQAKVFADRFRLPDYMIPELYNQNASEAAYHLGMRAGPVRTRFMEYRIMQSRDVSPSRLLSQG
jgi:hypothetical protein